MGGWARERNGDAFGARARDGFRDLWLNPWNPRDHCKGSKLRH